MTLRGLPLAEFLPPPPEATVLLLGGGAPMAASLRGMGYHLQRHRLDTGPLAELAGVPFTPPVVVWPFPDASFDAVLLLDELALTVREEEALAEAARVLRPGGALLLRVPATGRLAWLDGYNAYRYARDITKRGQPLREVAGVGWRRHYPRADLLALLRPHVRVRAIRPAGIGLSDAVRLALLLIWRWALRSERGDGLIRCLPERVAQWEGGWAPAGKGYWHVALAERLPAEERGASESTGLAGEGGL